MKGWSLTRVSYFVIVAVCLVVLTLAGMTMWVTTLVSSTSDALMRDAKSMEIATTLELHLLDHQRLANIAYLRGDAESAAERDGTERLVLELLREAGAAVQGEDEQQVYAAAQESLRAYFHQREVLDSTGKTLDQVVRDTRPFLGAAVSGVRTLRQQNVIQVEQVRAEARELVFLFRLLALAAVLVLAVALAAFMLGLRQHVVSPIITIAEAIRRFQGGERGIVAEASGPEEVREIAHAFNAMRDALERERVDRLSFVAGVAHDLRNPLSVLQTAGAVIEPALDSDPKLRSVMDLQRRQIGAMNRMLDDFLDAAQIEAGALQTRCEILDLRSVTRAVVDAQLSASETHDLTLISSPEPVWVEADPMRMEQVVSNLVSNAIKYSPAGGPISVRTGVGPEWAWLSVTDNGIGLAEEASREIFAPFRRQPHAMNVGLGSGLGLSIVRRIVEAHHGDIDVASEAGKGTTFTVRLPRHAGATIPDGPPAAVLLVSAAGIS